MDFRVETLTRNKEEHSIMMTGSIHQDKDPKYMYTHQTGELPSI